MLKIKEDKIQELEKYSDKYCEWKYKEVLDYDKKGRPKKWLLISDCGKEIIQTRDNKIGLLLKEVVKPDSTTKCPFCGKEIDIRCYD